MLMVVVDYLQERPSRFLVCGRLARLVKSRAMNFKRLR
jgi:hypothetical protein